MIEIKKEDIDANQYDDEYYNTEPFIVITPKRDHEPLDCKDKFCKHDEQLRKQLKQQILQDHEDSKKLERVDSLFTELKIPPPYDLWLANSLKDRQAVKNVEGRLDMAKTLKDKYMIQLFEDILR